MKKLIIIIKKAPAFLSQRKRFASILVVIILVFGVFIFQRTKPPETEIAKVEKGIVREELSLSGEIDATEKVNLSFQTGGLVSWVGVKKGDYVNKFQGIAALDQRSARKTLEKTLLDYSLKRSAFDETREENLNRTPEQAINNDMKRILERNQWNLELAVNSVEMQDLTVQLSTIYSPIDGIVTDVNTPSAGVNVAPFATQFVIVNPETIYFNVTADQTEVVNLKKGTRGKIVFDAYPNEEITGTIIDISFAPRTDEIGTVYDVKVALQESNSKLKYLLGMTGDITFVITEKKDVLLLPQQFVKTDEKGKFVYTDIRKKQKKYIDIGVEGEEVVEVKKIDEGTKVYD